MIYLLDKKTPRLPDIVTESFPSTRPLLCVMSTFRFVLRTVEKYE